ncbi:heme oxygenase [Herbihabitans rhizosphaerae]|uniref:Heme oxygenase n=1 Tax=Herbihabitans rhizosphaerae TaxID=1872711 RepID=A0A4V2EUH6_9PSEU|nr:biliverdin-producing heme oxygenase [Herbihabitans rhizosphaerae]RZS44603.1 heme oxygenase [Herbihabitans rhizosphaerae]
MTTADLATDRFSVVLREATREEHERTESSRFVAELLDGKLDRRAYVALLEQSYLFYSVLEEAGDRWRGDEIVGPFVSDALLRRGALEADLSWLSGSRWRDGLVTLPATQRYIDRLREVCFTSRGAFVAHHYTRYLGDLSGGQIIRSKLRSIYGLTRDGVRFYLFDEIPKPKVFKDGYRELLDSTPWAAGERTTLLGEANEAFRLNRGVFDDLSAGC